MQSDQVTRYLLGQLPEGEMQRLNALRESDENFRQRVRMVEDDLIECFVKGQLHGDDLMRFRRYFLASPANRERVKIAQGFLDDLNVIQAGDAEPRRWLKFIPASWQDAWQNFRQPRQPSAEPRSKFREALGEAPRVVMQGLALMLLAIVLFQLFDYARLKYRQRELQAENKAAQESQTAQQPTNNEQTAQPSQPSPDTLGQLKTAAITPEPTASPTPADIAATRSASGEQLTSFDLRPASRGAEGVPELTVNPNAEEVVFQLELGRDASASYHVELRAQPDGMRLWQSGTLKAYTKDYGKMLEVKVPAALLRTRAYTLKVYGTNSSGSAQEALNYSFRINKQ
jgi:hypothetical protein